MNLGKQGRRELERKETYGRIREKILRENSGRKRKHRSEEKGAGLLIVFRVVKSVRKCIWKQKKS